MCRWGMKVDVEQAKSARQALEAVIAKRLRDYEKDTGLSVTGINVTTARYRSPGLRGSKVATVEIEAEL